MASTATRSASTTRAWHRWRITAGRRRPCPLARQPGHRRGNHGDRRADHRPARPGAVGNVDIGAVESQGYTLTVTSGTPQTALAGATFATPLAVSVTPNYANDPVNGGVVTFTPPASGASASLSTTSATISGGSASVTATANGLRGAYTVTASASEGNSANFSLTNVLQPTFAGLNSATTTYGTPTVTFTGTLAAGTTAATGSVTVTISGNGITALSQSASLDPNGNFSATFNTAALPANPSSPYTVTYDYAAQDDFLAATDASTTLTVNTATLTITANSTSKTYGHDGDLRRDRVFRDRPGQRRHGHERDPDQRRGRGDGASGGLALFHRAQRGGGNGPEQLHHQL